MLAQRPQPVEINATGTLLAGEAVVIMVWRVAFGRDQHVKQGDLANNQGVKVMRDGILHQLTGLVPVPVSLII
ncbi:hypothetical protein D3C76_1858030 [compost metagenome]